MKEKQINKKKKKTGDIIFERLKYESNKAEDLNKNVSGWEE